MRIHALKHDSTHFVTINVAIMERSGPAQVIINWYEQDPSYSSYGRAVASPQALNHPIYAVTGASLIQTILWWTYSKTQFHTFPTQREFFLDISTSCL